jgi:hypothetical protein
MNETTEAPTEPATDAPSGVETTDESTIDFDDLSSEDQTAIANLPLPSTRFADPCRIVMVHGVGVGPRPGIVIHGSHAIPKSSESARVPIFVDAAVQLHSVVDAEYMIASGISAPVKTACDLPLFEPLTSVERASVQKVWVQWAEWPHPVPFSAHHIDRPS